MSPPIYLDYNATTPVAPEVLEEVTRALRDGWGNASSAHVYGRRAREAVDRAREQVAGLIGCRVGEVIFTSGGTESDNAAIHGVTGALVERGRHVVISAVEHPAVEVACGRLEARGFRISRVPVDENGRVGVDDVARVLRDDTVLISILHAQNETGVLQPISRIAERARERGIALHTDAAQSVGKLPIDVGRLGADLLTIAGHKLYAPQGVGALYVRDGTPFLPFLLGAGHEGGRRAGTENVAGIVGLGAACELATRELPDRVRHLSGLRDRLEAGLRRHVGDLVVHGAAADRLPNTLSAAFPGAPAEQIAAAVPGVATSAGAACHSGRRQVSAVLRAMGVPDELALSTLRLTVGRPTTEAEVDAAADDLGRAAVDLGSRRQDGRSRAGRASDNANRC